jgi:cyclase
MLRNRLIFTLLYNKGKFMLSRNFKLQSVGNLDWLRQRYDYDSMAYAIDELVLINVERGERDLVAFCNDIKGISKDYFMPLSVGGGIRTREDAERVFDSGADKLILCSALFDDPAFVKDLIRTYGAQSIVGCLDYKVVDDQTVLFKQNGQVKAGPGLLEGAKFVEFLGVGEIYLNSIDHDGTGEGFDWGNLQLLSSQLRVPVIASGGGGRFDHFVDAYRKCGVSAAATADLFNFMADSLSECRAHIVESGIPMASWDSSYFNMIRAQRAQTTGPDGV